MQRTIVAGAALSGDALADLKQWLGITRDAEDAMLTGLLEASLALCESFIGQAPLVQTVEERVPAMRDTTRLTSRPVQSLVSVEAVGTLGVRLPVAAEDYRFAVDGGGGATIALLRDQDARAVAVRVESGFAPDWASLPGALRQGITRMAAHHYRDRDGGHAGAPPPASVAALWRPWRTVRLT